MTHDQQVISEESARLVSPNFNFNATGSMCVDFFYLFTNPNHATLKVYVGQKVGGGDYSLEAVSEIKGGGAKVWRRFRKNIKVSEKEFNLVFDGIIKEFNASFIALDRIFINKGNCKTIFACDFDNLDLCSYANPGTNSFDWMVGAGGDDSGEWTKPDVDHTLGTDKGGFAYVNPGKFEDGQVAELQYPGWIHTSDKAHCLTFWIHFYGKAVGGLNVLLKHKSKYSEVLWHVDSDMLGEEWVEAQVSYSALDDHHFSFAATTMTAGAAGDIAIDDVNYISGRDPSDCSILPDYAGGNSNYTDPTTTAEPVTTTTTTVTTTTYPDETTVTTKTSPPTTTTTTEATPPPTTTTTATTTPPPEPNYDCNFDTDFCDWTPADTNEGHDWQLDDSGFAFTSMPDLPEHHTSSLVSYPHSGSQGTCMKFKYQIDSGGDNPGQLSILLQNTDDPSQQTEVWKTNFATNGMVAKSVNLKMEQNFNIVLQAQRENGAGGKVSVDDILLMEEECPSDPHHCDFDESSICGYTRSIFGSPGQKVLLWQQGSGSQNAGQGPDIDHSTGTANGYYMFVDGSAEGLVEGSAAMISSPVLERGDEVCAQVWFYMRGEAVGELNIYQSEPGAENTLKWTRQGGEDSRWETTMFPLDQVSQYQLKFQAIVTTPGANHIAFDDVQVLNTDCSIPGACTFANTYCSWTNSLGDTADWLLEPNYIHIDAKHAVVGKRAEITSMMLSSTAGRCAKFKYFIKGKDPMDCVTFWIWGSTTNRQDKWKLCNDQGDWKDGRFPIVSEDAYYISIEGTTGEGSPVGEQGVRVKLLTFTEDNCEVVPPEADPSATTTTQPPPTSSTTTPWVPPTTTVDYNEFGDCDFEHELCNWSVYTQAHYLGCFDDHTRLLPKKINTDNPNSPGICQAACKAEGFIFSGVQFGKECFCGNEDPPACLRRPEEECTMKCPGDENSICGGSFRMNIYKQGLDWQLKVASESNHIPRKDHTRATSVGTEDLCQPEESHAI